MAREFGIIVPRIFTDERLYNLDSDHKWVYNYCNFGLENISTTNTGIYHIYSGAIATGSNVSIEKTGKILDYFTQNTPDLLEYDNINHILSVKSTFKYLLRYNYLTIGASVCSAVHKDYKKYGKKAGVLFAGFTHKYHEDLNDSIRSISTKDKNYLYYRKTFDELFALEELYFSSEKPKTKCLKGSVKKLQEKEMDFNI